MAPLHLAQSPALWRQPWCVSRPDLYFPVQGAWPTRAGGNFASNSAPHSRTQHSIERAFLHIDGLRYQSRWGGQAADVLWATRPARRDPHRSRDSPQLSNGFSSTP